jgi:hypothetical protein
MSVMKVPCFEIWPIMYMNTLIYTQILPITQNCGPTRIQYTSIYTGDFYEKGTIKSFQICVKSRIFWMIDWDDLWFKGKVYTDHLV